MSTHSSHLRKVHLFNLKLEHIVKFCFYALCTLGGAGGRLVKSLSSKQEVLGSNTGATKSVGQ